MISMYGGADPINASPNKMIIRHSITYPTWGLSYNDADAQFNFLKNGVSVMDVDLGQSMLSVNGALKVTGGNPGNGKVLVCDSTGLSSWQDFTTKISAFQPTGCQALASATTTFQKVGDMGTFTKALAVTAIKLTLQTNVYATTFVGATGVIFELRVDGMATSVGNATALIRTAGTFDPINITGIFTGLSNASHTVSLWAKTINGTATNAGWDEGCLNASGTNNVLVEEYK
jgi:hypothetical protein